MYTWGYIKDATLAKLDLEESEAVELNLLNRFSYFANEVITQICSTIKPKACYAEFVIDGSNVGKLLSMPKDFVSFGNDVCTRVYNYQGSLMCEEIHGDSFSYKGYNQIIFYNQGTYQISYNARWIKFDEDTPEDVVLDVPADILDCIPSYIASQCYKIDDEYKSSTYRNEYEMFLARIDNTLFDTNKSICIEGDW